MFMMRRILIALSALLILCPAFARGQGENTDVVRDGETAVSKKAAPDKKSMQGVKKKKKNAARRGMQRAEGEAAQRRVWLFMQLGSVFDTNVEHDERGIASFGLVPSFGFHFQDDAEKPSFEAEYEVGFHRYSGTREFNRLSQYLTAAYRRQLSTRFSARTTGEVSLKGSSEDRDVNNQYSLEQQLQYRISASSRVSAFAAYRVKRYPLVDVGKNAIDPYIGAKFQQKLSAGRELQFSYRYDKNRSQDAKDRYVRRTYEAQFSTPLFKRRGDLLTVEARYSPRLYARQIKVDGVRVARSDRRWVLESSYVRPLKRDATIGLSYRFEKRDSNDVDKRYSAHVFGVTLGFKWWRKAD